jgi:hypothetical protein
MPGGSNRQLNIANVVGLEANRNSRRRPIPHLRSNQRAASLLLMTDFVAKVVAGFREQ